jgi:hypothetical protein
MRDAVIEYLFSVVKSPTIGHRERVNAAKALQFATQVELSSVIVDLKADEQIQMAERLDQLEAMSGRKVEEW